MLSHVHQKALDSVQPLAPGAALFMMNPEFLAIGVMAIGAAAVAATGFYSLAAGGALFLFLNPLVNVEVAFGETGRSVSYDKLALAALAAGFGWRVLKGGSAPLLKSRPITFHLWLACLVWILAAAWLSGAPLSKQFWGLAENVAYFITFLVFLDVCGEEPSRERILKAVLCGGLVMMAAVILQNLAFHLPWRAWRAVFYADLGYTPFARPFYWFRPGPVGNPNFLAAYLLLSAAAYPLLFRFSRPAAFIVGAAHLGVPWKSGSQGGLIGLAASCLAIFWINRARLTKKISAHVSPAKARLLLLFACASLILATGASVATHGGFVESSVLPRVYIHRIAGKMISERPLAGYGSGLSPEASRDAEKDQLANNGLDKVPRWRMDDPRFYGILSPDSWAKSALLRPWGIDHPPWTIHGSLPPLPTHSAYLKAFVETGLLGGVLFLCLMTGGLWEALLHLRRTGRLSPGAPEAWAWAGCVGVLFQAGTENLFSLPKTACLYWALTAFCLTARKAARRA